MLVDIIADSGDSMSETVHVVICLGFVCKAIDAAGIAICEVSPRKLDKNLRREQSYVAGLFFSV